MGRTHGRGCLDDAAPGDRPGPSRSDGRPLVPLLHERRSKIKFAAFRHVDHPDARQAIQIVGRRWDLGTGTGHEQVYLIISLNVLDAISAPGSKGTAASRTHAPRA